MIELSIDKLKKYYGAAMVLDELSFNIQTGERVGIIGENGCGKSTLCKILMGIEPYEQGEIAIRKGATLGYLEQMPVYEETATVIDVLNLAFEEIDSIYKQMQILEDKLSEADTDHMEGLLDKYSKLQESYETLGGYEKEEKLSKVMEGLKISEKFSHKLFSALSGGEKTTVILAKILLENPNILLLDEPSNHLDLDSMEWLENYLNNYKGTVLIISHDRYFLDNVVTKIIEIEDMKAETYLGNYSYFYDEKQRRLELQYEAFLNQQKKIKSMEKTISQLRDWGNRGDNEKFFKRAASMEKALDKIERMDKPIMEREAIKINLQTAERSGKDAIVAKGLCKRFEDKILLRNAELLVRSKERVALIGNNGCGKSTFIKMLLGQLEPDSGKVVLGSSVKLGYLPQNVQFKNEDSTVLENFMEDIIITQGKARAYLAKYLFYGEDVFKKVSSLSGGEKSRLRLAVIMFHEINMLILDEPTNHLDITSRRELEEILKEFTGTIFFISHDRYFINAVAERIIELAEGRFTSYDGNYDYYKQKSMEKKRGENKVDVKKPIKNVKKQSENEANSGNEGRVQEKLEQQIEKVERELKIIEGELNRFQYDYEKLNELSKKKEVAEKELEELMKKYFGE
ncbi:ribosomal protection-like ABC-F family protein [Clostridium oryzae]|uniref:Putative ABC transporter ATP-binding protein n=1 Tax=Clostridium oryzae TaxID=1450648 RepID=A0A1V4ID68_9CLOT|nr:ABC-F type ribosomal protection protein [Clostridium oryzae]OPJ57830.1 putative ABC transporter ATP-binding protein [Clostridium oryzae]